MGSEGGWLPMSRAQALFGFLTIVASLLWFGTEMRADVNRALDISQRALTRAEATDTRVNTMDSRLAVIQAILERMEKSFAEELLRVKAELNGREHGPR